MSGHDNWAVPSVTSPGAAEADTRGSDLGLWLEDIGLSQESTAPAFSKVGVERVTDLSEAAFGMCIRAKPRLPPGIEY